MKKLVAYFLTLVLTISLVALPVFAEGLFVLDPFTSSTFSADEDDDYLDFNFKDSGGAWVNIMNPWGPSAFLIFEPSEGFVQSMIITFMVEGYDGGDEGFRTMCGFGINGWSPSLWSLDIGMDDGVNWEEVFGEPYNFVVDGDGVYRMIVSFRAAMDFFESENDWYIKDFLEGVDCIELGFYGIVEDSTTRITILGVEESGDIFSFDDIVRPLGTDVHFAASVDELPPLPTPEPPRASRFDESGELINTGAEDDADEPEVEPEPVVEPEPEVEPEVIPEPMPEITPVDDSGDGLGLWIWLIIIGILVVAVLLVIRMKKKR
ncbi:MAG: hypothetical protein LBC96_05690 [Lachnospiraceae bacterium]|jgi:hypothetical protein|nr:hypothetical protein [Lachnospiraceae bacterium]